MQAVARADTVVESAKALIHPDGLIFIEALQKKRRADTLRAAYQKSGAALEMITGWGDHRRCLRAERNGTNMSYAFYGAANADVRDPKYGLTPCDYYDLLSGIWCAETCAPRMRKDWSPENQTLGQCSITAFLLQDIFGGQVYGVPLGDGNFHCFNVADGCCFDLTSEQFGNRVLCYDNCPEQFRDVHFAKAEKHERYLLLRQRLLEALKKRFPEA